MCVSPSYVYNYEGVSLVRVETACGWCWSCQKNRVNDLVGRCLLEFAGCDWSCVLTLTYDDKLVEHPSQTKVLHVGDFQEFMRKLRRRVQTRYLVAGEYGERRGRTHFHVVLFGYGSQPTWYHHPKPHIQATAQEWGGRDPLWKWGHAYLDRDVTERSFRYVAKYLTKGAKRKRTPYSDEGKFNKTWLSYSRIPIMGIDAVLDRAEQHVAERLFPTSFKYRPPGAAENREYAFTGEAQYQFLHRIFTLWPEAHDIPKTRLMENASLRYRKEAQRRAWDALPADERQKWLDVHVRNASLPPLNKRLYLRTAVEWMESNVATWEEFKTAQPDIASLTRSAFYRDISKSPPRASEVGPNLAARFSARSSCNQGRGRESV